MDASAWMKDHDFARVCLHDCHLLRLVLSFFVHEIKDTLVGIMNECDARGSTRPGAREKRALEKKRKYILCIIGITVLNFLAL